MPARDRVDVLRKRDDVLRLCLASEVSEDAFGRSGRDDCLDPNVVDLE
jgi:hypothetical protein